MPVTPAVGQVCTFTPTNGSAAVLRGRALVVASGYAVIVGGDASGSYAWSEAADSRGSLYAVPVGNVLTAA